MALNIVHDKIDDIPEQYRDLYSEREGKLFLTGVAGIKTQADVDRVQEALRKEREDHKEARNKLSAWSDLEPDEVRKKLDRYNELEVLARGKSEEIESKLEELTEARVRTRLSPVERELNALKAKHAEAEKMIAEFSSQARRRSIHDKIREQADKLKVRAEALPDVLLLAEAVFDVTEDGGVLTKENPFGINPGLSPDAWLADMQQARPHWWPTSSGGGANGGAGSGSFGKNPWSADNWNMTEQAKVLRERGEEVAARMAQSAGTTLGGLRPAAKK